MVQHWRQSVKLELCTTASNFNKSGKWFFSEKYRHIVLKCSWKLLSSRPLRNFHTLEVDSKFSPAIFANVFLYAALAFATNEYDFIWTDEENCWKRIYNTQLHHSTAFLRSLSRPYLAFVIKISTPGFQTYLSQTFSPDSPVWNRKFKRTPRFPLSWRRPRHYVLSVLMNIQSKQAAKYCPP